MASLKGVSRLLQEVDHQLGRQEGLPVRVDDGAEREVGALPDALLQLLDAVQRSFFTRLSFSRFSVLSMKLIKCLNE